MFNTNGESNIPKLKKTLLNIIGEPNNNPIKKIEDIIYNYRSFGTLEEKIQKYEDLFESILVEIKNNNNNER